MSPWRFFFPLPFQKGEDEGEVFFLRRLVSSGDLLISHLPLLITPRSALSGASRPALPKAESEGDETLAASDVKHSRQNIG